VTGQAGSFDGVDDWINVKNSSSLKVDNKITISSWVNIKNNNSYLPAIIQKGSTGIDWDYGMTIYNSHPAFRNTGRDFLINETKNNNDLYNVFHHFLIIVDENSNQKVSIYIDGVLQTGTLLSHDGNVLPSKVRDWILQTDYDLNIGLGHPNEYLEGEIDDLRIYNRALNDSEIQALYKLGGGKVTITHNAITYGTVISPHTGRVWLDRNLGALKICENIDDTECYGDYYQWGRKTDGHEKYNSKITENQAQDLHNTGALFIKSLKEYDTDWAYNIDPNGIER